MPKAIHYKHPKLGYHACGMGDRNLVKMSDSINEVTCKRCLTTATGKSAQQGRPTMGSKPKVNTTLRIDPDLKEWAQNQDLNLSSLLEEAIKARQ